MKTIDEIYTGLKSAFQTETGITLNDGGDMVIRFRAFAAQLVSLMAQAEYVERQCFPQTATGTALDTHALSRGLTRIPASKSTGTLRFSLGSAAVAAVTIPIGTRCMTAQEQEFEVTAATTIAVGSSYCDAPAAAVTAGSAGNVAADTVIYMELPPAGVVSCTNTAAFSGGSDAESDDTLRQRVLDSFANITNSGNIAYYRNHALTVNGIVAATVQPRNRGRGTVDITIASENGAPTLAQIAQVSNVMNGRREICVDVYINSPTLQTVNVAAAVSVASGHNSAAVLAAVEAAIRGHFTGRLLGKGLKLAELGSIIYAVEGVENYSISSPAADLTPNSVKLPVLGTLSVSEAT